MNNIEEFTKLFKFFEVETKKKIGAGKDLTLAECIEILIQDGRNPYVRESSFINFCRRLRNMDFHNVNVNYYLITDETIKKFKEILYEVQHPFKVEDKATSNIYSKCLNDFVLSTMQDMFKESYTHIPIYDIDGKTLVGIFSENSLFQYIMEDKTIEINEKTTFRDIIKCIDINKTKEIVKFVARSKLYDDVVNDFVKEFNKGKKLACIMVTENGRSNEKVIGIITAWDVIGR